MLKSKIKTTFLCGLGIFTRDFDNVSKDSPTVQSTKIENDETGLDRLKMMYSTDEFGNMGPEMTSVMQIGCMGLFIGSVYGGFISSKTAYIDFMENNQATVFKNHFEAKKKLQDYVTVSFAKGAFKWGWRLGLFSSSYVLISTSISVYRGKSSIVEYLAAGGLAGMLYKFQSGPRGMVVGGALGTVLGGIGGALTLGILSLTGMTTQEVRYWQYNWKKKRDQTINKMLEGEKDVALEVHDQLLGERFQTTSEKNAKDSDSK